MRTTRPEDFDGLSSFHWRRIAANVAKLPEMLGLKARRRAKNVLGRVGSQDYLANMPRLVIPILALGAAIIAAVLSAILFGSIAHDWLGVGTDTIRADALIAASFVCLAMAGAALLRRKW